MAAQLRAPTGCCKPRVSSLTLQAERENVVSHAVERGAEFARARLRVLSIILRSRSGARGGVTVAGRREGPQPPSDIIAATQNSCRILTSLAAEREAWGARAPADACIRPRSRRVTRSGVAAGRLGRAATHTHLRASGDDAVQGAGWPQQCRHAGRGARSLGTRGGRSSSP